MTVNIEPEMMAKYLAFIIALKDFYQTCHWRSKGKGYYGDHLLFERLYNDVVEEVDQFAEKSVAMSDETSVCPIKIYKYVAEVMKGLEKDKGGIPNNEDLIIMAFESNESFMKATEKFYDILEEKDKLTLGMDDFLTALYSKHEEHYYLLNQRKKEVKNG